MMRSRPRLTGPRGEADEKTSLRAPGSVHRRDDRGSRRRLFEPLGIRDWAWGEDGKGVTTGGTDLYASALDLAKLGYFYLRGGDWFARRLLGPWRGRPILLRPALSGSRGSLYRRPAR